MGNGINRLLWLQLALSATGSALFLVLFDRRAALAAGFGGGISLVNAWLLARCSRRDAQASGRSVQQTLVAGYACSAQRFIVVALLFGTGMGLLNLTPVAMIVTFIIGQAVLVISATKLLRQS